MTRPAETRLRIIEAVLRIIGEDGVAGVTNRRIAGEAGVSLGSVTYHFATQQDLLKASLLHFVTEETRHFCELAERAETERADFRQVVDLVGRVAHTAPVEGEDITPYELYLHAGRVPELHGAAAECFAAYDRLAASALTALGVPDAEKVAGVAVGLVMGLRLRALATGSDVENLVDVLLMLARGAEKG